MLTLVTIIGIGSW